MYAILGMMKQAVEVERKAGVFTVQEAQKQQRALDFIWSSQMSYISPEKVQEVMTTARFEHYFSNILSRKFYKDYSYSRGDWRNYVTKDTAPDFRKVERYRLTEPGTLYPRGEKQEAYATEVNEEEPVTWGVEEFARQFDVSWRAILNDDLGEIRRVPQRMANVARRFEDRFVSNLYDNATTQAALIALGAGYAGTGRLTLANLMVGVTALTTRSDAAGDPLEFSSIHVVIPRAYRVQAAVIWNSELAPGVATNDKNVVRDFIKGFWIDPYITTTATALPWYLIVDPSELETIVVGRLEGNEEPWVSKKKSDLELVIGSAPAQWMMGDFVTGNITYMVNTIIGGNDDDTLGGVVDPLGIYYSSGTTP